MAEGRPAAKWWAASKASGSRGSMTAIGPSVWTGRALQAKNDDPEMIGLALLYPALDGTFEFLAIMDIRARSISFATRPRRPYGPPDHKRAGETFSPSPHFRLADLGGKANFGFGIS